MMALICDCWSSLVFMVVLLAKSVNLLKPGEAFCQTRQEGEIRLTNGSSPLEGRVELCRNGLWGTVCDPFGGFESRNGSWDQMNARVVCRQVGRQFGVEIFTGISRGNNAFNNYPSDVPVHINRGISCDGTEQSLTDCPLEPSFYTCGIYANVGVTCVPTNSTLLPVCSNTLQNYNFHSVPLACPQPVNGSSLCLVDTSGEPQSFYNNLRCNGHTECGDCSDECHCSDDQILYTYNNRKTRVNVCRNSHRTVTLCNCTNDEFQCANGFCVPKDWRCDGQNGCGDFSDETNNYCRELRATHRQQVNDDAAAHLGLSMGVAFGLSIILILLVSMVLILCLICPCCPARKLYSATPTSMVAPAAEIERETEENVLERSSTPLITNT